MSEHKQQRIERAKAIAELLEQDLTLAEIGRRLGLTGSRVGQIVLAHGLSRSEKSAAHRKRPRQLSQRQTQMLAFVRDFIAHNSYPPTIREVVRGCNLSSTSVANHNLYCLKEMGYLTRIPSVSRGIVLTERGKREAAA